MTLNFLKLAFCKADQMNSILKGYFFLLIVWSPRVIYLLMELGKVKISLFNISIVDVIEIS